MSIALNKRQLLAIVLVLIALLVTTLLIMHGTFPAIGHQILHAKPQVISRYG